jgi:hypothetical protein
VVQDYLNDICRHQPFKQEVLEPREQKFYDQEHRGDLVVGNKPTIVDGPEELFTLLHVENPGHSHCND